MKGNTLRRAFFSLAIILLAVTAVMLFATETEVSAQASRGWRVWIRTDPCPGRFDWLSVAKDPPAGGKNVYVPYETLIGNQGCTLSGPRGCTFEEATELMESLRSHNKFLDLCCHDYSVWENSSTNKRSIVVGKQGTAGFGWQLVKSDLCCEEAEELAGIPGSCGGKVAGGKGGGGAFGGKWNITTQYGDIQVSLTQTGSHVTGTFSNAFASGTLDGTITGSTLTFKWRSGPDTGSGDATISSNGRSFTGSWKDDETHSTFSMQGTKGP